MGLSVTSHGDDAIESVSESIESEFARFSVFDFFGQVVSFFLSSFVCFHDATESTLDFSATIHATDAEESACGSI